MEVVTRVTRFLGQLALPAFIPSTITGALIPIFEVDLVHGNKKKRLRLGFDTGMTGAHLEVPRSLARELGIVEKDKEIFVDASGPHESSVGFIDWIGLSTSPECGVRSAKVIFHENAPTLIGNDFMRDIGASIRYGSKGPQLSCSKGAVAPGIHLPKFRIFIANKGVILNKEALFDTGWDGADLAVPYSVAQELGVSITGTQTARTHTGRITYYQGKADRVGLRDLSQCHVNGAVVDIHPPGSAMDDYGQIIIGEPFFKKTGGMIGYDAEGAFFRCRDTQGTARATKTEWFPYESIMHEVTSDPGWIVVAGALALTGTLAYLVFRK